MACRFQPDGPFPQETYSGVINTDWARCWGSRRAARLAWAVFAPTNTPGAGRACRVSTSEPAATSDWESRVGANVLLGGSASTIALQPVSLEGTVSVEPFARCFRTWSCVRRCNRLTGGHDEVRTGQFIEESEEIRIPSNRISFDLMSIFNGACRMSMNRRGEASCFDRTKQGACIMARKLSVLPIASGLFLATLGGVRYQRLLSSSRCRLLQRRWPAARLRRTDRGSCAGNTRGDDAGRWRGGCGFTARHADEPWWSR